MLPTSVGIHHVILPPLATQMGVREQPVDLDVVVELDHHVDLLIGFTGRDLEVRVEELPDTYLALGWPVGEDHPHPRTIGGRLTVGRVVNLEDQLGAGRNQHGAVWLEHHRVRARRHQADQVSRGSPGRSRLVPTRFGARGAHPLDRFGPLADWDEAKTGSPRLGPGRARERQNVMHYRRRSGPHLEGPHPLVLSEVCGHPDGLIPDLPFGRHLERLGHFDHHIGRADLPPGREHGRRRQLIGRAERRAGVDPPDQGVAFVLGQPTLVLESPDRRVGVPRWHLSGQYLVLDGAAPGPGLLIRHQRHRRHLARTMAGDTILVENGRDVFRECGRLRLGARRGTHARTQGCHERHGTRCYPPLHDTHPSSRENRPTPMVATIPEDGGVPPMVPGRRGYGRRLESRPWTA